jgi:hypothetical protein
LSDKVLVKPGIKDLYENQIEPRNSDSNPEKHIPGREEQNRQGGFHVSGKISEATAKGVAISRNFACMVEVPHPPSFCTAILRLISVTPAGNIGICLCGMFLS